MNPRILVTVSRSWTEWSTMREALEAVHARYPNGVLVHGDAPKGDRDAAGIWRGLGGQVEPWPAMWRVHADCRCRDRQQVCKLAGFRRSTAMVESAPDLCLAFINKASRGATHCMQAADDAGIPTVVYRQGQKATELNVVPPEDPPAEAQQATPPGVGNVSAIALLGQHPDDCEVCGTHGVVKVSGMRWRDGRQVAAWPAELRMCPLRSGADSLAAFATPAGPETGGGAA